MGEGQTPPSPSASTDVIDNLSLYPAPEFDSTTQEKSTDRPKYEDVLQKKSRIGGMLWKKNAP